MEEDAFETDTEYIVVVNVRRYLKAKADTAASYYARSFGSGITGLKHLHDVASNPKVIDAVVNRELEDWAAENAERIEKLRRIAGTFGAAGHGADPAAAIRARFRACRASTLRSWRQLNSYSAETLTET